MTIGNRLLAKNVGLNFVAQVVPLIAALFAIPILVRGLGASAFGVLTLVWAAIGYFGLFDLGIGRALTHAVAIRDASGDRDDLAAVTWTAVAMMFALGAVGGLAVAVATPALADRWLHVPATMIHDTRRAFYLMAFSLPFALAATGLRGVMEGFHDFRTATLLRTPIGILQYLGPVAVLPFSTSLAAVVGTLVALRVLSCALFAIVCLQRYPILRSNAALRSSLIVPLLRFGGWLTVSNIVSPVMVNLDRFMIAGLLPMAAVAYYVTPYELVTKLTIIPTAILGVMFPALTAAFATDRERMSRLADQSVRAILVLLFPATLMLVLFAHEGLAWWISPTFAAQGSLVLQILAIGVLVNCTAGQVAYTALQGAGRPDLTARVHLIELPVYLAMLWFLARTFGLPGVAVAWTLRVSGDAITLWLLAARVVPEIGRRNRSTGTVIVAASMALVASMTVPSPAGRVIAAVIGLAMSAIGSWRFLLQADERILLQRFFGREVSAVPGSGSGD